MLRKLLIGSIGGLLFFVAARAIFSVGESDYALYEELLKKSNPEKHTPLLSYTQQQREKVSKQVWYQETTPLYIRIDSEESELFFFRQNNRVEIVEQLNHVVCLMQESLYFEGGRPMQRVRYMEADRASYNYSNHLFIGEDVQLWRYQLEGHTPPEKIPTDAPLMQAKAATVEFTLDGERLDFTAHRMRATLNTKEAAL